MSRTPRLVFSRSQAEERTIENLRRLARRCGMGRPGNNMTTAGADLEEQEGKGVTNTLEFEAGPRRILSAADDGKTVVFCGDGGPVRVEAPADLAPGHVTDLLQRSEGGIVALVPVGGATLTMSDARTRGRGSMLRLLAVAPGGYAVIALG